MSWLSQLIESYYQIPFGQTWIYVYIKCGHASIYSKAWLTRMLYRQSIGAPIDPKDITVRFSSFSFYHRFIDKFIQTPEEDQTELANYDAKVYKASAQMADALASELRGMGIPFFVLRTSLIQDSSCSERESPTTAQNAVSSPHKNQNQNHHPDASKLTRSELKDLQRRMLELLQDLCKE